MEVREKRGLCFPLPRANTSQAARLFPNQLHEHSLRPAAVEFTVEDLLPGAEVKPASRDRYHHLAAHHLPLEVSVGVVLAGPVMGVTLRRRVERREPLEPPLVILVKPRLIIVDEYAGGDVHRIDETKTFSDAGASDKLLDLGRDLEERHPGREVEGEIFGE